MTASVTFDSGRHEHDAAGRPGAVRAFKRARRHSRVVRSLRFGIPIAVVATLGLYGLVTWLNPLKGLAIPEIGKLAISGTRITMEVPRLAGYTRDGRGYEITANAAAQDLRNPQFIELKELRAKIELEGSNTVTVTADMGSYDTKSELMSLRDNVVVKSSTGTEVRLSEANMDMRKGSVISERPVEVDMPTGQVRANALDVAENGAVIVFRGGVTTFLNGSDAIMGGTPKKEAAR